MSKYDRKTRESKIEISALIELSEACVAAAGSIMELTNPEMKHEMSDVERSKLRVLQSRYIDLASFFGEMIPEFPGGTEPEVKQ